MKRTKLKPVSLKQAKKNKIWRRITEELCQESGYVCRWCGYKGQRTVPERLDWLTGHHILSRARGGIYTKENCYTCHITCHQFIHDKNVDVKIYHNKEEWLKGNG